MRFSLRLIATLAAAAVAAALTASCGADPTPTPSRPPTLAPYPTPTPTPTPSPAIAIDGNDSWRDVASDLSAPETDCIRSKLGAEAYEALLDTPALAGDAGLGSLPVDCLEQENAVELIVARIDAQADGLSPESDSCLRKTLADADIGLLANAANDPDAFSPVIGGAVALAQCLNDEESAAVSIGDLMGEPAFDFTVAQFRCIAEHVDIEALLSPPSGGAADDEPALSPLALLQALSKCDVDLSGFGDAGLDGSSSGAAP